MRVIDLSLPIQKHWRWYSGTFLTGRHEEGDTFRKTNLVMAVHGYTHVDAPAHFVPGGPTIDRLPIEMYCGAAAVLDLTDIAPGQGIEPTHLAAKGEHLQPGDIALLRSDWPRQRDWQTMAFWAEAPFLTPAGCQWLLERKVKAVGMDFPGDYVLRYEVLDRQHHATVEENTTHRHLLANGVGLIEYLTNLHSISRARVQLYALPLKINGSDGSPVRAIAVED